MRIEWSAAMVGLEAFMNSISNAPGLRFFVLTLALAVGTVVFPAVAQQETEDPFDQLHQDTRAKMEKERRDGEWKKLKEDTDKLFQATSALRDLVEKSNKDTLSLQILKKTEELEKILKDIKRRAKDGF
jgi:predicted methyltransferase